MMEWPEIYHTDIGWWYKFGNDLSRGPFPTHKEVIKEARAALQRRAEKQQRGENFHDTVPDMS